MLIRRLAAARPINNLLHKTPSLAITYRQQRRWASSEEAADPGMTGGYQNPPAIIRQNRDPYGDWWDKQERRNFGEPVHEDDDIMGMFTPEDYNFYTAPQAFALLGCFIVTFLGVCGAVAYTYPDQPAVQRGFEGGLDRELGGPGAVPARTEDGID